MVMRPLASRTLLRSLVTFALVQATVGCHVYDWRGRCTGDPGTGTPYSVAGEVATCSITGADASRMTAVAGSTYSVTGAVASWATARVRSTVGTAWAAAGGRGPYSITGAGVAWATAGAGATC